MLDPSTGSASVSWMDIDLSDPSVQKHVRDGLKLDRLALSFDELLTCVIDQEMVIRKLRFSGMDGVEDDAPDVSGEDPLARLDAEFVLLTGTLHRLVGALKRQLNGFGGGA